MRHYLAATHGVDELFLHPPGAALFGIDHKRAHRTALLTELQVGLATVRHDERQRAFIAEDPGLGLAWSVTDYRREHQTILTALLQLPSNVDVVGNGNR